MWTRLGPSSLAQCVLCHAGAVLFYCSSCHAWRVDPLGGNTTDWRAGCGRPAGLVRREGGDRIGSPCPYQRLRLAWGESVSGRRARPDLFCGCLGATPNCRSFLLWGLSLCRFEGGHRGNKLFQPNGIKIYCSSILVAFHYGPISVFSMANVLPGFKIHDLPLGLAAPSLIERQADPSRLRIAGSLPPTG